MLFKPRKPTGPLTTPLRLTTAPVSGLFAGTLIATPDRWAPVEELEPGDMVWTSGQGAQEITRVEHGQLNVAKTLAAARQWPLMVPAGALGDNASLLLAPSMRLVVDDPAVSYLFETDRASLKAEALVGFQGVARAREATDLSHVRLGFSVPVTLVLEGGGFLDMPNDNGVYRHMPLDERQSRLLIRHLGEAGRKSSVVSSETWI